VSYREVEFTKNREAVGDLMARARKFHMPISATSELDVTELRARLERERERGRPIGLAAYLTAATAKLVASQPRLNHHLFTDAFGRRREVAFDQISCTVIVQRKSPSGEDILFPLVLRGTDRLGVDAIHARIREHKQMDLEELPQFKDLQKVKKMPRLALRWFSFKARSDPDFYLKYFGTYGLSSLVSYGGSGFTMSTIANTAVAFFPATIKDRPVVVRGEVVPRTIMNFGFVFDHYLIDGLDMTRAIEGLREVVEDPTRVLGPEPG
jgi:pyruvate/2-oxoglutarate dehydrogenase complex dihydrolipoamide acyltransferase (E2) component